MPTVNVPSLGDIEFPEGTPNDVMERAIKMKLLEGPVSKQTSQGLANFASGPLADEQKRQESEFTRLRQEGAVQEANRFNKRALSAVVPAAAAAASFAPGMQGLIPQTLLGAAVPAVQQSLGNEPYSLKQIGLGAVLPGVMRGVTGAGRAVAQKTGNAIEPGLMREGGVEAANQTMGRPATSGQRAATNPTPADIAFQGVRNDTTPINTSVLSRAARSAQDALPQTMPPKLAKDYLGELENTFNTNPQMTIAGVHKEINGMGQKAADLMAKGETESGKAIMDARAKILDQMDNISPGVKEANSLYRRQQAASEITSILRKAGPGAKVRELFENDKLSAGAFSPAERKEIEGIADQLSAIGATGSPYSGVTAKVFNVVAAPLAAAMTTAPGRYLIRQTFKSGGVTPQALSTIAMFGRAMAARDIPPEPVLPPDQGQQQPMSRFNQYFKR